MPGYDEATPPPPRDPAEEAARQQRQTELEAKLSDLEERVNHAAEVPQDGDACRAVDLPDGSTISVRGTQPLTGPDVGYMQEIVDAARRKFTTEHDQPAPRRFYLQRNEDETGTSGTGRVVDGVRFVDGTTVIRWLTDRTSTAVYNTVADLEAIHGHGGKTRIVWIDEPPPGTKPDPAEPQPDQPAPDTVPPPAATTPPQPVHRPEPPVHARPRQETKPA